MPMIDGPSDRKPWVPLRALFVQVMAYGLVSLIALGVDAGILNALVIRAGWHYLPASSVSFVAGAGVAYLLSIQFVFRARQSRSRALEFFYFFLLGLVGLLINAATLSVAIGDIGLGLLTAKLVAAVCTFSTNFALRRTVLFSVPRTTR